MNTANDTTLTVARLRLFVDMDPDTARLYWRSRKGGMWFFGASLTHSAARQFNTKSAGKRADKPDGRGYTYISIRGKNFRAHRVVWALHYGEWPTGHLDHMNGIRDDNRVNNLRVAGARENNVNKALDKRNRFGCHGIVEIKRLNRFAATINIDGKTVYLKSYATVEEAIEARLAAEKHYGYHPNHGRKNE
jgi:hypothetical protein